MLIDDVEAELEDDIADVTTDPDLVGTIHHRRLSEALLLLR